MISLRIIDTNFNNYFPQKVENLNFRKIYYGGASELNFKLNEDPSFQNHKVELFNNIYLYYHSKLIWQGYITEFKRDYRNLNYNLKASGLLIDFKNKRIKKTYVLDDVGEFKNWSEKNNKASLEILYGYSQEKEDKGVRISLLQRSYNAEEDGLFEIKIDENIERLKARILLNQPPNFTTKLVTLDENHSNPNEEKKWENAKKIDDEVILNITKEATGSGTFTKKIYLTADVRVTNQFPNTNFGSDPWVPVSKYWTGYEHRGFFNHLTTSIPSNATIIYAKFKFYVKNYVGTDTYTLRRVTATWTEGGITWNNQPGVSDTINSLSCGAKKWYEVDITNAFKNWWNATWADYGFRMNGTNANRFVDIYSKEFTGTTYDPYIEVKYSVPESPVEVNKRYLQFRVECTSGATISTDKYFAQLENLKLLTSDNEINASNVLKDLLFNHTQKLDPNISLIQDCYNFKNIELCESLDGWAVSDDGGMELSLESSIVKEGQKSIKVKEKYDYTALPQYNNILHIWKLEEEGGTRYDAKGDCDLADNNTVLYGAGKIGNGADFEKDNNEYLDASNEDSADMGFTDGNFSFSFAWRPETLGITQRVIARGASGEDGWNVFCSSANTLYLVVVKDWTNYYVISNSALFSVDTLYLITIVRDGTTGYIYVDKVDQTLSSDTLPTIDTTTDDFTVGTCASKDTDFLDGLLDELIVWNVALTPTEVSTLYDWYDDLPILSVGETLTKTLSPVQNLQNKNLFRFWINSTITGDILKTKFGENLRYQFEPEWSCQYNALQEPPSAEPAWTLIGTDYASVADGILTIDKTAANECSYKREDIGHNVKGNTILARVKVDNATKTTFLKVLDGIAKVELAIYSTKIEDWNDSANSYTIDMTKYRDLWLTIKNNFWILYIDGVFALCGETQTTTTKMFNFGMDGSANLGKSYWDYVYYYNLGFLRNKRIEKVIGINNLNLNPSIEVDTSGYTSDASTISRNTTEYYKGIASLKCITNDWGIEEGFNRDVTAESSANQEYTFSVYLKGSGTVKLKFYDNVTGSQSGSQITLSSTWTRYSLTKTFGAGSTSRRLDVVTDVQQSITFYSDALMHTKDSTLYDYDGINCWKEFILDLNNFPIETRDAIKYIQFEVLTNSAFTFYIDWIRANFELTSAYYRDRTAPINILEDVLAYQDYEWNITKDKKVKFFEVDREAIDYICPIKNLVFEENSVSYFNKIFLVYFDEMMKRQEIELTDENSEIPFDKEHVIGLGGISDTGAEAIGETQFSFHKKPRYQVSCLIENFIFDKNGGRVNSIEIEPNNNVKFLGIKELPIFRIIQTNYSKGVCKLTLETEEETLPNITKSIIEVL